MNRRHSHRASLTWEEELFSIISFFVSSPSFFAISLNFVIKEIFEKYSVSCPEAYSIFLIPFQVARDIGSFGLGFGFIVFLSKTFVPFVEKRRLMDEVLLILGVAGISILGLHAVLLAFGNLGGVGCTKDSTYYVHSTPPNFPKANSTACKPRIENPATLRINSTSSIKCIFSTKGTNFLERNLAA